MSVTIDLIDQDVYTALIAFLSSFLPTNTPIIQGQDNQVSMPLTGFVVMTNAGMERLGTNVNGYNTSLQTASTQAAIRYTVALDFIGPLAQSWASMCQMLFRSEYGVDLMPATIQPLYTDDPMQIPLIAGEAQYEQRWRMQASVQYNPTITTAQQSATSLAIGIFPIETTFHP
jgi:hypothetical protein